MIFLSSVSKLNALASRRLKRPWTNNFFYRDCASFRFHTTKTQSARIQTGMASITLNPVDPGSKRVRLNSKLPAAGLLGRIAGTDRKIPLRIALDKRCISAGWEAAGRHTVQEGPVRQSEWAATEKVCSRA
jgi:hypothetical protein